MKIHETLESVYSPLEEKRKELMQLLAKQYPAITWGWYNGHYHRTAEGWARESYPIPVITVKGLCDIELSFREMTVTAKLPTEELDHYAYDLLQTYPFEAFGTEEFLKDYARRGDSIHTLKKNLLGTKETSVTFSFPLSYNEPADLLFSLLSLLESEGFSL